MSNIYYNPKAHGLQKVEELEMRDASYEFDLVAVWKNERDEFFWAQSSGCSCPTPFDEHDLKTIDRLTKENFAYFEQTVRGQCSRHIDASDFLREVENAMRGPLRWPMPNYTKAD